MKHIVNITDNIITVDVSDNIIEVSVPTEKPILVKVPKTLDEKIIEKIPKVKDGKKGDKGPKGDKGEKGDKGDKGDPLQFEDLTPQQIARLEGPEGPRGIPGVGIGIATGGTTGQVLAKKSNTNYDTEWINDPAESDTLQSVTDRGATTTNTTTFSPSGNNKAIIANGSGSGTGIDITHTGSGTKLNIGDGGSGDLIVAGTDKFVLSDAGKLTMTGDIEANAFITTGGTSSEFVKGDGSLGNLSNYQMFSYFV